MCSTAQLVSITINSAANEPRFTIIKERVNVLGKGLPLLFHTASVDVVHTATRVNNTQALGYSALDSAAFSAPVNLTE